MLETSCRLPSFLRLRMSSARFKPKCMKAQEAIHRYWQGSREYSILNGMTIIGQILLGFSMHPKFLFPSRQDRSAS